MKTYGVRSSVVYNMKSTSLCIAILITCSGRVIGDLEFYPDYQRSDTAEEEWVRDVPTNQDFQNVYDEPQLTFSQIPQDDFDLNLYQPHADLTWPNVARQNLLRKQKLASRIHEMARNYEETDKKPQYYFKTDRLRRPQTRMKNYDVYRDRNSIDYGAMSAPNYGILDDIRLNTDKHSSSDEFNLEDLKDDKKLIDPTWVEDSDEDSTSYKKDIFSNAKLVDDPSEFAYAPSDPRYFQSDDYAELQPPKNVKVREDNENIPHNFKANNKAPSSNENYRTSPNYEYTENASEVVALKQSAIDYTTGVYIIAIVAGISAAATVGLIAFGIGWYNLQKHAKNASDVEYPAYGVTGPNKDISPSGDRRLAQSAQMYHYQHQKQQIIAMERAAANERHGSVSEVDSDEENEEGDYTVYECPGLAPTGEMEVKNPLFHDDPTPAQTPALKISENNVEKK